MALAYCSIWVRFSSSSSSSMSSAPPENIWSDEEVDDDDDVTGDDARCVVIENAYDWEMVAAAQQQIAMVRADVFMLCFYCVTFSSVNIR